jgi:hypothetical protein
VNSLFVEEATELEVIEKFIHERPFIRRAAGGTQPPLKQSKKRA